MRVWIINNPNPARSGSNTMDAYIIDSNGQPVSDAQLTFSLNMTNMNMGRNVVTPVSVGNGQYSGKVYYSMGGPWRVTITIVRAGHTNTAQFDFTVYY
jgi:hypothetical protein